MDSNVAYIVVIGGSDFIVPKELFSRFGDYVMEYKLFPNEVSSHTFSQENGAIRAVIMQDNLNLATKYRKIFETYIPLISVVSSADHADSYYRCGACAVMTLENMVNDSSDIINIISTLLYRSAYNYMSKNDIPLDKYQFDENVYMSPKLRKMHTIDGEYSLTETEVGIFGILSEHRNEYVEKKLLLDIFWNGSKTKSRTLDVYITRLRNMLRSDSRFGIDVPYGKGLVKLTFKEPNR